MNCVEVRERLAEQALGLCDGDDRWQVERHLEWCAGCRKESNEMLEGVERVALELPAATPRPGLEERVVHEVLTAAGRRPRGARRQTVRALAVATLAAVVLALGAVGWGVAEREKARNFKQEVDQALATSRGLTALVEQLRSDLGVAARGYQTALYPGIRHQPAGTAVVFAPRRGDGFALVTVVTPVPVQGSPYSVLLTDGEGHSMIAGELSKDEDSGHLVLAELGLSSDRSTTDSVDLANLTTLAVVDKAGNPVLTGTLRPYTSG